MEFVYLDDVSVHSSGAEYAAFCRVATEGVSKSTTHSRGSVRTGQSCERVRKSCGEALAVCGPVRHPCLGHVTFGSTRAVKTALPTDKRKANDEVLHELLGRSRPVEAFRSRTLIEGLKSAFAECPLDRGDMEAVFERKGKQASANTPERTAASAC